MPKLKDGRKVFDLTIRHNGKDRSMSVGRVLPAHWFWARATVESATDTEVLIRLRQIVKVEVE